MRVEGVGEVLNGMRVTVESWGYVCPVAVGGLERGCGGRVMEDVRRLLAPKDGRSRESMQVGDEGHAAALGPGGSVAEVGSKADDDGSAEG